MAKRSSPIRLRSRLRPATQNGIRQTASTSFLPIKPAPRPGPSPGATFILIHKLPKDPAAAAEALKFFAWAYAKGDKMAEDLDYVPLPEES